MKILTFKKMRESGDILSELLKNKGITPYILSKETKISESTISRIINQNSRPNLKTVKALCDYFNIEEDYLRTGINKNEINPKNYLKDDERIDLMKLYSTDKKKLKDVELYNFLEILLRKYDQYSKSKEWQLFENIIRKDERQRMKNK